MVLYCFWCRFQKKGNYTTTTRHRVLFFGNVKTGQLKKSQALFKYHYFLLYIVIIFELLLFIMLNQSTFILSLFLTFNIFTLVCIDLDSFTLLNKSWHTHNCTISNSSRFGVIIDSITLYVRFTL
jgi:phosphatidylserine synthase